MRITFDKPAVIGKPFSESFGILLSCWCGFGLAFYIHRLYDPLSVSLMRTIFTYPVSIVCFSAVLSLSVILTVYSVVNNNLFFLYCLYFTKVFRYSFCVLLIYKTFGTGGWLAQFLLMFSDTCVIVAMIAFGLGYIFRKHSVSKSATAVFVIGCALLIIFDVVFLNRITSGLDI